MKRRHLLVGILLIAAVPLSAPAQFMFATNNNALTITYFAGPASTLVIPGMTNGLPVTAIAGAAFASCPNLKMVTIPASIITIGEVPFVGCPSLETINVDPENPAFTGDSGVLFDKRKVTLVTCPIGKAGSYDIPDNIRAIDALAFAGCSGLTSVAIPQSVTSIGEAAFYNCTALASLKIPSSVVTIVHSPCPGCRDLQAIDVATNNLAYKSLSGILFDHAQTTLEAYPPGKSDSSYTIPAGVTKISYEAFYSCINLTNIDIPESVTAMDDSVFYGCSGLVSMKIPDSVTTPLAYTFVGCTSLASVRLSEWTPSILQSVFANCTSLLSIVIPGRVTDIGTYAFLGCTHLASYFFKGDAPNADAPFGANSATVYYLPGTSGWTNWYQGYSTAHWALPNPVILSLNSSFGLKSKAFGFKISWETNRPVVVEASETVNSIAWQSLQTNTLSDGWTFFSDPNWTNHANRMYRIRSL